MNKQKPREGIIQRIDEVDDAHAGFKRLIERILPYLEDTDD